MIFGLFRLAIRIAILLLTALVVYFAVCLVQVWLTSRQYDPHPAGAIMVMGAAQYNGVPSPDLAARLNEALKLLNAEERATIILCCQNGLSHEEAAQVLACPLGTVKTHILRGKEKMRQRLTPAYENYESV